VTKRRININNVWIVTLRQGRSLLKSQGDNRGKSKREFEIIKR